MTKWIPFEEIALEVDPNFYRWYKRLGRKLWWKWETFKWPTIKAIHDWTDRQGACNEYDRGWSDGYAER